MVKPGGTGSPRLAISARLAPLPPSKSRNPALPSALPSPNVNTHLPDFAASVAGLLTALLPAGFGAGLAGLFFKVLRALASGAALARAGAEGFDFAAIFLGFDAALAMTYNQSARGRNMRALHHVWAVPRKARTSFQRYKCSHFSSPRPIRPLRIRNIATTRLSSRGMIRMSRPAITDMTGEMWATVRVIERVSARAVQRAVQGTVNVESRRDFIR